MIETQGSGTPIKLRGAAEDGNTGDNIIASMTNLDNIIEENAMEDMEDTSQEKLSKNPKTEDNGTNEMDVEMENGEVEMDISHEIQTNLDQTQTELQLNIENEN